MLSVKYNITISSIHTYSSFDFIRHQKENHAVNVSVKRLKIRPPSIDKPIANLSGGNQQKAIISRLLAMNPRIMILDEPTMADLFTRQGAMRKRAGWQE